MITENRTIHDKKTAAGNQDESSGTRHPEPETRPGYRNPADRMQTLPGKPVFRRRPA